ncbi:SMP-30/gluconolactonase/LRE family protein [Flavitalea flava]
MTNSCKTAFYLFLISLVAINDSITAQQPAAVVADKFLIPESITYNETTGEFLISSQNKQKIVAVRPGGSYRDFISSAQDSFLCGVGVKVDPKRHVLWALSNSGINNIRRGGIWAYDLGTAKLLKKWIWTDTAAFMFNDLVIDSKGNIFISESFGCRVYYLEKTMDQPRLLLTLPKNNYLNGIALSDGDERYLFIACYQKGIVCYDRQTKENWELQAPEKVNAKGLDGLFWYKNSLIGVDNSAEDFSRHKIVQYTISPSFKTISRAAVIDEHNPFFDVPTSAVIAHDSLFVLANSQLGNWDDGKEKIKDSTKLKPIYILSYDLKKAKGIN